MKEKSLDIYEGNRSEILYTTTFVENSDLVTTCLGKVNISRSDKIQAEEKIPISEQDYTIGKLLDSTECQILSDTRASESFISKIHYLMCKSVQFLTKICISNTENSGRKWTVH